MLNCGWKEYSVEIHEWSGTSWVPYVADDVQLQFYMMSPYVLKTLSTNQQVAILLQSSIVGYYVVTDDVSWF